MTRVARFVAVLAVGLLSAGARAHHGVSTYRMDVVETLAGLVVKWEFGSPHTWLTLGVDGVDWQIEGAPPRWMTGQGFTAESLVPGEVVTIVHHPHRSTPQAGILMEVRRADGSVLKVNRPAALGGP